MQFLHGSWDSVSEQLERYLVNMWCVIILTSLLTLQLLTEYLLCSTHITRHWYGNDTAINKRDQVYFAFLELTLQQGNATCKVWRGTSGKRKWSKWSVGWEITCQKPPVSHLDPPPSCWHDLVRLCFVFTESHDP